MPIYWRGNLLIADRTRPWWPYGEALLRGWQRGLGAGVGAFVFALAAIACEMVDRAFGVALPDELTVVFVVGVFVLMLNMLAIMLFNRPKFLVPPCLQSQPGALSEWFGSRRGR